MADFEAPFEGAANELFEHLGGELDGELSVTMLGLVRPRFVLKQRRAGWRLSQRGLLGERLDLTLREERRPHVLVGTFRYSLRRLAACGLALGLVAELLEYLGHFSQRGHGLAAHQAGVMLLIPLAFFLTACFGAPIALLISKARADRKVMLAMLRDVLGLTAPADFPPRSERVLREVPVRGGLPQTLTRLRQRFTELASTRLKARRRRLGLTWVAISRREDCWWVVRRDPRHREVGGTLVLAARPGGTVLEFRPPGNSVKPPSRPIAVASSLGILAFGAACGVCAHLARGLEVGTSDWLTAKLIGPAFGAAAVLAGLPLIAFGLGSLEALAERSNGANVRKIFEEVCDDCS